MILARRLKLNPAPAPPQVQNSLCHVLISTQALRPAPFDTQNDSFVNHMPIQGSKSNVLYNGNHPSPQWMWFSLPQKGTNKYNIKLMYMSITIDVQGNPANPSPDKDAVIIYSGYSSGVVTYQIRRRDRVGSPITLSTDKTYINYPQIISISVQKLVIILEMRQHFEVRAKRNSSAWTDWSTFKTRDKKYSSPGAISHLSDDAHLSNTKKGRVTIRVTNNAKWMTQKINNREIVQQNDNPDRSEERGSNSSVRLPDDYDWPIDALKTIRTFPKRHFLLYRGQLFWEVSRPTCSPVAFQMVRITRCATIASPNYITSGLSIYLENSVRCCIDVNRLHAMDAGIFITTLPYGYNNYDLGDVTVFGYDPTYYDSGAFANVGAQEDNWIENTFKSELEQIKFDLGTYNLQFGSNIKIIGLHINTELFGVKPSSEPGYAAWNAAVKQKNDKIYNAIRSVFPAGGAGLYDYSNGFRIIQYEFQTLYAQDESAPFNTYWQSPYYNFDDLADQYSCVYYQPFNIDKQRASYDETVLQKNAHGGAYTALPMIVHVSLASGWVTAPNPETDFNEINRGFRHDLDYGLTYAFNIGKELRGLDSRYTSSTGRLDSVVLYPEPFASDPSTPLWLQYFLAYADGQTNTHQNLTPEFLGI